MPIKVVDTIKPDGLPIGTSLFPTVEDIDILGGYQVVGTDVARNNIPSVNRKQGMLVYVVADSLFYQLASDLVTWNVANFAGDANLVGDVTGPGSANTVTKIRGVTVSTNSVANDGYALVSTSGSYVPTGVVTVFNVKNFGAKGDGATDDHLAFQAAVAAKDAAGGGIIFIPFGVYKLTTAIDIGSAPVIIRGSGWRNGNTSVFGDASWNSLTFTSGTILHFTSDTNGLVVSYSGGDGRHFYIEDVFLVGPGTGTTHSGINMTTTSGTAAVRLQKVGIANFYSGYFIGICEGLTTFDFSILGCVIGLNGQTFLGSNYTNCHFYRTWLQGNTDGAILSGLQTIFYGGLIQSNTRGVTIKAYSTGGTGEHYFNGVWFEANGTSLSGPDIMLDSSSGPIENIGLDQCRMAADSVSIQWSGLQLSGTVNVQNGQSNITFTVAQSLTAGQKIIFGSQPATTYQVLNATTNSTSAVLTGNYTGTTNAATTCTPGNYGISYLTVKDCDLRGGAITIPSWVADAIFVGDNNAGITDNSSTGSVLIGTSSGSPSGNIHGGYFEIQGGASVGQVRLKADASQSGVSFRGHSNTYDVNGIRCDNADEIIVGDSLHGYVGLVSASGTYKFNEFGGSVDVFDESSLGTTNTQTSTLVEKHVVARTVNAATTTIALSSIALGGAPASGHCWMISIDWSCRDISTGNCASGNSKGIISAANGVEGSPIYVDSGHNAAIVSANVVISTGPNLIFTPPGSYSGTLDWLVRIRIDIN